MNVDAYRSAYPELTIVVPILNERDNIRPFYHKIQTALRPAGFPWEILFVNDSTNDGTIEEVRALLQETPVHSIRMIQRMHRFGLSSACIEGVMASHSPFIVVMDVDGQHDETLIPKMYEKIKKNDLDVVIASRNCEKGSLGSLGKSRAKISQIATVVAQKIGHIPLTDPMSGFFIMRRSSLEPLIGHLFNKGFKILLDIFLASPSPLKFSEMSYTMRSREFGESKLSSRVILEYFMLFLYHRINRWVPLDFISYLFVGVTGAIFHLILLRIGLKNGLSFLHAQSIATLFSIFVNFYLNNLVTFSFQSLKGTYLWKGLLKFMLVSSVGFYINLALSDYIYRATSVWWLSGGIGFFVSGIWNYLCSATIIWKAAK